MPNGTLPLNPNPGPSSPPRRINWWHVAGYVILATVVVRALLTVFGYEAR